MSFQWGTLMLEESIRVFISFSLYQILRPYTVLGVMMKSSVLLKYVSCLSQKYG